MRKHVLIAVAVLAVGGVIAHMHVATQTYTPVVRVETPGGVSYTAVLDPSSDRPSCGDASDRFIEPLKADCPECRIVLARCRRKGEVLPALAEHVDQAEGHSLVRMPGVTITIDGRPDLTRLSCEQIADSVHRWGVESARCIDSFGEAAPRT